MSSSLLYNVFLDITFWYFIEVVTGEQSNIPNRFRILSIYEDWDNAIPESKNSIWIPSSQWTVPRSVTSNSVLSELTVSYMNLLGEP